MIQTLCQKIWKNPTFQSDFNRLMDFHHRTSLGIPNTGEQLDQTHLAKLAQAATHFALSDQDIFRQAGYQIATALFYLFDPANQSYEYRHLSELVLSRLGNFPAIQAFYSGNQRGKHMPESIWFERESHFLDNTINITPKFTVTFTDFQKRLWDQLESRFKILTVTAPTSAGKSFALKQFLLKEFNATPNGWFVYLVPSRALINQLHDEFAPLIKKYVTGPFGILTTPTPPSETKFSRGLFILTQERLQTLLDETNDIEIKLAIVDEAQAIGDSSRGIILHNIIERILKKDPNTRIFFGCPFIKNPEIFGSLFESNKEKSSFVLEKESPVTQNLLILSIKSEDGIIEVTDQRSNDELGKIPIPENLKQKISGNEVDRLVATAQILAKNNSSLIYCSGPASCEDLALNLSQDVETTSPSENIKDFSDFLKDQIHTEFPLVQTVLKGVGFHYGKMPAIVRRTVEEMFTNGQLQYLACTSTLLHGVNLPAKNMFMFDPTKGHDWKTASGIPLNGPEFWNLAGRAGRLGKEFEGNVFLVDYDKWNSKPATEEKFTEVIPSVVQGLTEKKDELIKFLQNEGERSGSNDLAESTFMKLFLESQKGTLDKVLDQAAQMSIAEKDSIRNQLNNIVQKIKVPSKVIERNSTISVLRQQELLDYFSKKITDLTSAEEYLPTHPNSGDAYAKYIRLFKRIHNIFEKIPKDDDSHKYFAAIALSWMRGQPIARMVDKRIEIKKKKMKTFSIPTTIREVLTSVEDDLRFRYVKYVKCHNDILSHVFAISGMPQLIERIPAIPLYLELGACDKTTINFIATGISRTTSSILSSYLPNKDMTKEDIQQYLIGRSWEKLKMSVICKNELRRHLGE